MTLPDYPRVGVMPTKLFKGMNNLDDACEPLWNEPFQTAWNSTYDSDAHFVCYYPLGTGQTKWARCNKPLLPKLRREGADLVTRMLVLDYDRPHHQTWSPDSLADWLTGLMENPEPLCQRWNVLYTTRHGARLVYVLDEEVPVDKAEDMHRWLTQRLREAGVSIDDIDEVGLNSKGVEAKSRWPTSDWTRCFRLPRVVRDGQRTWEEDYFELIEQPEQVLEVKFLGELEGRVKTEKADIHEIDEPMPDLNEALELLEDLAPSGRMVQSAFFKEAKRRLVGRDCYPCLFEHAPLAPEGARDNTIMKYVGEAATMLYQAVDKDGVRITTMDHLFGLFIPAVAELEPDHGTSDWFQVLWRAVRYCWAREEAEEEARTKREEAKVADAIDKLTSILDHVREWCEDPALGGTDAEAMGWLMDRLIVKCGPTLYPMTPRGRYDPMGVTSSSLIPRIRALGMEELIQFKVPTKDGKGWAFRKPQDLIDRHATVVARVCAAPGKVYGGWVKDMDLPYASLQIPTFSRREDLTPKYDLAVENWLRAFFGAHFEEAENWLAHALAVEEGPICALSIRGEQGAGKKLLAQGLGECFTHGVVAGPNVLTGQYQGELLTTPVVCVDEGWPPASGGKHPADMFRELVGGGKRLVDQKYKSMVEVRNPARILFTANSLDVVYKLCGSRDMSPEDRNALAIRIMHYDIGDAATKHLRALGGIRHTRGWIAGDGGSDSEYVIARHLLWLYHNRRGKRGARLLVEGNGHETLMSEMRTRGGSAPLVVETLLRMIETKTRDHEGLSVEDGRLYVLSSAILTYYRDHLSSKTKESLSSRKIGAVLKGLVTQTTIQRVLDSRPNVGRKCWHEIDLVALRRVARDDGWECKRLDGLISEQIKRGTIGAEHAED